MKYNCKQCAFGADTAIALAQHVRLAHLDASRVRKPYPKRTKIDPETKLLVDAYALFDASEASIDGRLRVLKYLQDRYTLMLEPIEQERSEAGVTA